MKGVKFGDKHSYRDFGLILTEKDIGSAEPKLEQVEVDGIDGKLDLTDALGRLKYKNRTLSFTFTAIGSQSEFLSKYSEIQNYLHGKKMRVILDDDPSFYYEGRCTVNKFKTSKRTATIVIDVDAAPYKLDVYGAGDDWSWDEFSFIDGVIYPDECRVSGEGSIDIPVRNKAISPIFTASADGMKVAGADKRYYDLKKNIPMKVPEIQLTQENQTLWFTGTGTVKLRYRGGSL